MLDQRALKRRDKRQRSRKVYREKRRDGCLAAEGTAANDRTKERRHAGELRAGQRTL